MRGAWIGDEFVPNASPSSESRERTRDGVRERECLACAGWFELSHFYFWSGKHTSRCRACMKSIIYQQRDAKKAAKLQSKTATLREAAVQKARS